MNHKKSVLIFATIVALVIGVFAAYLVGTKKIAPQEPVVQAPTQTACTQEAMQCPDGSYVGREGPNCEFAACPTVATAKDVYQGQAMASFEGSWQLNYTLNYNKSQFVISTTSKKNEIAIKNIETGSTTKIFFSYEGARGYTPVDYWKYEGQSHCPSCMPVLDTIKIKYTIDDNLPIFASGNNNLFAVKQIDPSISGESWLVFIQSLPQNDQAFLNIIQSLTIMQSAHNLSNVDAPNPPVFSPQTAKPQRY